jgi:putative ABC transport system permease protein
MSESLNEITNTGLLLSFLLVIPVLFFLFLWRMDVKNKIYALFRMLLQLLLIGFVLNYIFAYEGSSIVLLVITIMIMASSWISLNAIREYRRELYAHVCLSIALSGLLSLMLITLFIVGAEPWYEPRVVIPLAGMVFANSMNSVSLAAERVIMELSQPQDYESARMRAFNAALIPVVNSLMAVGLVSLPGMMTGQILSGVAPVIAAKYQIVIMCMLFGSTGLSVALFLTLARPRLQAIADRQ